MTSTDSQGEPRMSDAAKTVAHWMARAVEAERELSTTERALRIQTDRVAEELDRAVEAERERDRLSRQTDLFAEDVTRLDGFLIAAESQLATCVAERDGLLAQSVRDEERFVKWMDRAIAAESQLATCVAEREDLRTIIRRLEDDFEEEREELIQRKPDHEWVGEDGHNCKFCHPDSIWKCDEAAHLHIPRWEDDPVAIENGWVTPGRCRKCGESNSDLATCVAALEEAHLGRIEAQNPGIDMEQVKSQRRESLAALKPTPKEEP